MPGIDASIPLGIKPPDQMQNLSSLLGVANGMQTLQQNQQKTQQGGIDLQERQAMQKVMSDPSNYSDDKGNFDLGRAQQNIMRAAPTTGSKYIQEIASAHQQGITANRFLNAQTTEVRQQMGQQLLSMSGADPEVVIKGLDAFGKLYKAPDSVVKHAKDVYQGALNKGGQEGGKQAILQLVQATMPPLDQQTANTPGGVPYATGTESGVISTKPGTSVPVGQKFATTETQVSPSNQEAVDTDAQGNKFVVSRTKGGAVVGTRPLESSNPATPGPFTLPQGETKESMAELQAQRTAAQQTANSAPVMHDINQTIVREASKGLNTGSLGQLTQKVASATGYNMAGESATDYNLLGKMLERSALTAAQSMGPHTNAGLEASIKANGSLEYTPTAIKKIAYLNDALVSGAELYRDGLEKAIGSSQNNIFAKRQFDQQWSKVATPQALRLKNAVDNKNPEEVSSILKEVGGKGSEGATKLHKQLTELIKLSGR